MIEQAHQVAVPPRHLAATITAMAVLRAGWAVAGVYLFISAVTLGSLWVGRHYNSGAAFAAAALVAVTLALVAVARRPTWVRGMVFLFVGTVATFVWVYTLLSLDPMLNMQGIYLLNRMTIVLLLVGAVSSRLVHGLLWCTAGWLLGSTATAAAQLALGLEMRPGYGPTTSLIVYLVIIVMFVLIRRNQQRFVSPFSANYIEPARITGLRELEERAVILLHDTVLNDLVAIAQGKDELDERTRSRFQRDILSVVEAKLEPETIHNHAAQWLHREILAVVSDFQWRGLRVDITGGAAIPEQTSPRVAEAIVGAIRGCLENVVRHSASDSAEIFVDASPTEVSVMIVDQGIGFDVGAVPDDRLGIRQSIVHRIAAVGGSVRVWSAVDAGTSVVIVVPLGGDDD